MLYQPWPHWTRWCTSHNHQLQYLLNSKTTSNSCCINHGHTGPDGVQVTIISYNIYQTLKLLVTHVVLTLVTLDQIAHKSQPSVTIKSTRKLKRETLRSSTFSTGQCCTVKLLLKRCVPFAYPKRLRFTPYITTFKFLVENAKMSV